MSMPERRPAVTVLLPVFEQAAFLPRALESLLAQTLPDWEAWVLDDGSQDATPDLVSRLARDPRIRTDCWADNRGLGATLNAGLDRAAGPLIAYLPADDVWYPDHLASLVAVMADPVVALAWSGVRHHVELDALDAPPGFPLQLVQVAHRAGAARWTERAELESDDLDLLMWSRLREPAAAAAPDDRAVTAGTGSTGRSVRLGRTGRTGRTGTVTCAWTDHPGQRHKAIRESFDGGLNVFRSRYRVAEPLRFHSSDSGAVDEVDRYARFRERAYQPAVDGLSVLLVGELAFNPERVLALAERGHRLSGLWTRNGLGDATVGPLPFGHVADLPRDRWRKAVRELAPDVIHAQLNWRTVPFAAAVRRAAPEIPFVWHFKEAPQRSIVRGEWPLLADLVTRADACLLATQEERRWFETALAGVVDPGRLGVLDGDLPKREWLDAERSPKLSAADGQAHTVVLGRPSGLDGPFVLALARAGVHVHLYGQVAAPGPKGAWRGWLDETRRAAPDHVHVHPAVGPEGWVRELSRYDAGWLHRFASRNGGDLHRASWDDLNSPARLPVLLAAGLPALQRANPGHLVSVERVLRETGAGLLYDGGGDRGGDDGIGGGDGGAGDVDDLVDRLRAEVATGTAGAAAWQARERFTYDAHADDLVATYRRALERAATLP